MNYKEMNALMTICSAPVIDAPLAITVTAQGRQTVAIKTVADRRRKALHVQRDQAIEGSTPLDGHDSDDNHA
jgi:hypothetical protein